MSCQADRKAGQSGGRSAAAAVAAAAVMRSQSCAQRWNQSWGAGARAATSAPAAAAAAAVPAVAPGPRALLYAPRLREPPPRVLYGCQGGPQRGGHHRGPDPADYWLLWLLPGLLQPEKYHQIISYSMQTRTQLPQFTQQHQQATVPSVGHGRFFCSYS